MLEVEIGNRWSILLPDHRANVDWATWEKERIAAMYEVIKPGDIIFDVGAEEGDISGLMAMWAGSSGNVCPIEPSPRVWSNIKAIWEANNLPTPQGFWVGFAADVDDFDPPNLNIDATVRDGWPECAYGEIISDHGFRHLAQEADATPRIKLDTFCEMNDFVPDVITMDVEGAEYSVLKGAEKTLTENSPIVFVSIHPEFIEELYGVTGQYVVEYMESLGYESFHITTDHEEHWRFSK